MSHIRPVQFLTTANVASEAMSACMRIVVPRAGNAICVQQLVPPDRPPLRRAPNQLDAPQLVFAQNR